jgi:hypothetical protein
MKLIAADNTEYLCNAQYLRKCMGHPLIVHEGTKGEKIFSSTLSSTSALDGGGCSTPLSSHFTPGKDPVPIP